MQRPRCAVLRNISQHMAKVQAQGTCSQVFLEGEHESTKTRTHCMMILGSRRRGHVTVRLRKGGARAAQPQKGSTAVKGWMRKRLRIYPPGWDQMLAAASWGFLRY